MQTLTPVPCLQANASFNFSYLEFLVHKFILLLLLFLCVVMAAGQPVNLKYRLEFKSTKTTYFAITDTTAILNGADLAQLRKHIVVDSTIREVDINNDITTTIYHLKDTQFEDWMIHPAKTVVSKFGIISYNDANKVLLKSPHSEAYMINYKKLKLMMSENDGNIIPEYTFVTADLIQALMEKGFTYSDLGPEGSLFSRDTVDIYINNNELTDEIIIYSGSGIVLTSVKHGFIKNEWEQVVPSFTVERTWDDRFPGNCVRKVVVTDYDGYKVTYTDEYRGDGGYALTDNIVIFPNPVGDNLNIYLPADYFSSATIEILDATGLVLLSRQFASVQHDLIVPIAELASGMYVLRLYDEKKEISKPFFKN